MTESEKIAITKYDLLYEQRMTQVESAVESLSKDMKEIRSDVRWIIGIMLGGYGSLFALMAHGFHWF